MSRRRESKGCDPLDQTMTGGDHVAAYISNTEHLKAKGYLK